MLNRFCGSGIWKDIARMACFNPMMPRDSAKKSQMAGRDEAAENQNLYRLAHLPGQIWLRLDAPGAINQSIYIWPLHMPSASSQYGGLRGWNFLHCSFDVSAPCGQVRSCIAFCDLVSEVTQHHFLHILLLKAATSPPRLQRRHTSKLHLFMGKVSNDLWPFWKTTKNGNILKGLSTLQVWKLRPQRTRALPAGVSLTIK